MAKGDYPSDKADQYMLRFPEGMRDHLKAAADRIGRSMNAEIIARIQDYEATGLTTGESVAAHIERLNRKLKEAYESRIPTLPQGLWYRVNDAAIRRKRSVAEEIIQALEAAYPAPVIPELDDIGYDWYWKYADAAPEDRESVLEAANADLKARGLPHEFWPGEPHESGTPTLKLGIRHFGPKADPS